MFESDPILQEFREQTMAATNDKTGEACKHYRICYVQSILYKLRIEQLQVLAHKQEREHGMAHHMQACLVLKQFEYILNVTEYVNENYLRVTEKFIRAIDYEENIILVNLFLLTPHADTREIVGALLIPEWLWSKQNT